jgi:hypothetical protein
MTTFPARIEPLTDGVVTLRLPSPDAGDVDTVLSYIEEEQLDGGWLPEIPLIPAEQAVRDWSEGWATRRCRNGPTFVVTIAGEQRFIGHRRLHRPRPRSGGDDLRDRAAMARPGPGHPGSPLAAQWALSLPGVATAELRIDQDMSASQHVAVNAGFILAGTVTQFVPGTGETFEDRGAAVSGVDRPLHERLVCLLVSGVGLKCPLPQPGGFEQLQVQRAQPFARLLGPRCLTVLGQQLALIGIERAGLAGASGRLEG